MIGGEDGQAGGSVDHVIDQVADRRRAEPCAVLYEQRVPGKDRQRNTMFNFNMISAFVFQV